MNERDLVTVAGLHAACLPDSLVASLGPAYVRSFYRYAARSPRELVVTERNGHGLIVAVALVSLEPGTFQRRLLLHTSLLWSLARRAGVLVGLLWAAVQGRRSHAEPGESHLDSGVPEMLLIYTAARERRRGRARGLLREVERQLQRREVRAYRVRTVLDPSNSALAFYRRQDFVPCGTSVRFGTRFQVFARTLDPGSASPPG
ncbi:MAG: GNAT family N-acetyltransferase [Acidimicrobiia bacterium]|nr:GNAT family N-acetyltransferase [Acidimicrobiia bacterium]